MRMARNIVLLVIALTIGVTALSIASADDFKNAMTDWKQWKSIETAIALRPLDGPEDILEKVEIIEDRLDELAREKVRLKKSNDLSRQKLSTLRNHQQILQDLSDIKMGGDAQSRQRLHDLAERIRSEQTALKAKQTSFQELTNEMDRLKNLADEYRKKARLLKRKEGGAP